MWEYIDHINSVRSMHWSNNLAYEAVHRRPEQLLDEKYHFSEEFGSKVTLIDSIVATFREAARPGRTEILKELLADPTGIDRSIAYKPEIAEILKHIAFTALKDHDEEMEYIFKHNLVMRKLLSKYSIF